MSKIKNKKNSLIQEWAIVLKKKEWKSVSELSYTSLVKVRPKTKEVLSFFAEEKRLDIAKLQDKKSLVSYASIDMTEADWKKMSTEIPTVCSKYIQIKKMNENPIPNNIQLQLYFSEKGMYKSLDMISNKNKKAILESPIQDHYMGYYLTRYREAEMFDLRNKSNRQRLLDLDKMWDAVHLFSIENGLRLISEKANRATFLASVHITDEQKEWYKNIPKKYIKNNPQIRYYKLVYQMFNDDSPEIFMQLWKELKKQDIKKVSYSYSFVLFHYLSAFCTMKTSAGNSVFHQYYIDINKFLINKKLFLSFGKTSSNKLKNIVKSGLEINDIKWTECFLNEFRNKIADPKNAETTIRYCEALIHFYKKEYGDALGILDMISHPKDNWLKISSYYLHLITLVILDYSDKAENMSNSLREMVYRKDVIAKNYTKSIQKGLVYINRILKLPDGGASSAHYQAILDDVKKENSFKEKSWLIILLEYKLGNI